MRLLLDTVALYRAATAPDTLPPGVQGLLRGESSQLFLSIASAWELSIKASLGKLPLPCRADEFYARTLRDLNAQSIGVELSFVAKQADLPHHHGDPFDRMIIAQALTEGLTVLTSDTRFSGYGVPVRW